MAYDTEGMRGYLVDLQGANGPVVSMLPIEGEADEWGDTTTEGVKYIFKNGTYVTFSHSPEGAWELTGGTAMRTKPAAEPKQPATRVADKPGGGKIAYNPVTGQPEYTVPGSEEVAKEKAALAQQKQQSGDASRRQDDYRQLVAQYQKMVKDKQITPGQAGKKLNEWIRMNPLPGVIADWPEDDLGYGSGYPAASERLSLSRNMLGDMSSIAKMNYGAQNDALQQFLSTIPYRITEGQANNMAGILNGLGLSGVNFQGSDFILGGPSPDQLDAMATQAVQGMMGMVDPYVGQMQNDYNAARQMIDQVPYQMPAQATRPTATITGAMPGGGRIARPM